MSGDPGYTTADGETTGGWSGSEASHDRASHEQRTGRVHHRRAAVMEQVRLSGLTGVTWYEIAKVLGIHHGAASGALSNLHKAGQVARLKERRGGSSIYVRPIAVNGRPVAPYGRHSHAGASAGEDVQAQVERAHNDGWERGHEDGDASGWQRGYDEGVAASNPQTAIDAARWEGVSEGADRTRRRAIEVIGEMHRAVGGKQISVPHGDKCWLIHVPCALEAAAKAVANTDRVSHGETRRG